MTVSESLESKLQPGLYLCGGSTHPGGNITGLCGYNAARVIAADLELERALAQRRFDEVRGFATTLIFELHDAVNQAHPAARYASRFVQPKVCKSRPEAGGWIAGT